MQVDLNATIPERAARIIRQRVLSLETGYHPGDRLYPLQVAADLGVSITPVREALRTLAAEGVIDLSPRRGASVRRLSMGDLEDLITVRAGLEELAIRIRGGRFSAEELSTFGRLLEGCEHALARGDYETCRASDADFHHLIVFGADSVRLRMLYRTLLGESQLLELYNPHFTHALRESLEEHRVLLACFQAGGPVRAARELAAHWERSRERIRRKFADFVDRTQATEQPDSPPALRHGGSRRKLVT
jgi:DNA-binding GntR family transcriptional regulator